MSSLPENRQKGLSGHGKKVAGGLAAPAEREASQGNEY